MHSSRAAGIGPCAPAVPWLLSRPLALLCSPEISKSCALSCRKRLPEASKTSPGGVNLKAGSFISWSNTRNASPPFRIPVPQQCLPSPWGWGHPHSFPWHAVPETGSVAMADDSLWENRAGVWVPGPHHSPGTCHIPCRTPGHTTLGTACSWPGEGLDD